MPTRPFLWAAVAGLRVAAAEAVVKEEEAARVDLNRERLWLQR
jgi:hypothetical protein